MMLREEALLYSKQRFFKNRVAHAQEVVAATLEVAENPYIGFSTGKDSTCVVDLVLEQAKNIPIIYFDADCSLPESIELLERMSSRGIDVERFQTEPLFETYKKYGLDKAPVMWTTVGAPLFRLIDERDYDFSIIGLRSEESAGRKKNGLKRGEIYYCNYKEISVSLPILRWTESDVWAYIHSRNLDYNKAYEKDGVSRVSYWAGTTGDSRGRFVELKRHWPGLFNRLVTEFPEVSQYG